MRTSICSASLGNGLNTSYCTTAYPTKSYSTSSVACCRAMVGDLHCKLCRMQSYDSIEVAHICSVVMNIVSCQHGHMLVCN